MRNAGDYRHAFSFASFRLSFNPHSRNRKWATDLLLFIRSAFVRVWVYEKESQGGWGCPDSLRRRKEFTFRFNHNYLKRSWELAKKNNFQHFSQSGQQRSNQTRSEPSSSTHLLDDQPVKIDVPVDSRLLEFQLTGYAVCSTVQCSTSHDHSAR
jgi:hypothetical protein